MRSQARNPYGSGKNGNPQNPPKAAFRADSPSACVGLLMDCSVTGIQVDVDRVRLWSWGVAGALGLGGPKYKNAGCLQADHH